MERYPSGKVETLPKWAQAYIRLLEGDKADLEKRLAAFESPAPEIYWMDGAEDHRYGIPESARVNFHAFQVRHVDQHLEIYHPAGLLISAEASNVFRVYGTIKDLKEEWP